MNKLYSLLTVMLLIPCFIMITSCSDDKSSSTGEPINQASLTPIEKNKIDTYAGTYKGAALSFDKLSTSDGRQILNFGARVHLSKQDDNNLAFNYVIQYSGYNQANVIARDEKLTKLPVTDITYISKDSISFSIKNGTKTYTITLIKEKDQIDSILPDSLWQAEPLCNATKTAISGVKECKDPSGALSFIASYRVKSLKFIGCNHTLTPGVDFVGELTANPKLDSYILLPIVLKLQFSKEWLNKHSKECGIQNNNEDFLFINLDNKLSFNPNNLDLEKIFTDIGMIPNATTYSKDTITYLPKKQQNDLSFVDYTVWGKKVTIELEVIKSANPPDLTGNSIKEQLTNTPYWK